MGKKRKKSNSSINCVKRKKPEEKSLISTDFTLPGFNYLGPGGKEDNGPPTNPIDAIAKEHDEAYDKVIDSFKETHNVKRSIEEIEAADQKFLQDIEEARVTNAKEAIGKAVGFVGIGVKSAVEKALGFTVYPDFDKIKANDTVNKNEDKVKVQAGDDFNWRVVVF